MNIIIGIVHTVTYPVEGGTSSVFNGPSGLAIDQTNNVCYVGEIRSHTVKRIYLD
jgi:DNA-binding beta-propeller fold protein YncE